MKMKQTILYSIHIFMIIVLMSAFYFPYAYIRETGFNEVDIFAFMMSIILVLPGLIKYRRKILLFLERKIYKVQKQE